MAFINQLVAQTDLIPTAFTNTFSGTAVGGGSLGTVVQFGNGRGVFSNEADLDSAPIADAASNIKDPVAQCIITICQFIVLLLNNFQSEETEIKAMISGDNNKH